MQIYGLIIKMQMDWYPKRRSNWYPECRWIDNQNADGLISKTSMAWCPECRWIDIQNVDRTVLVKMQMDWYPESLNIECRWADWDIQNIAIAFNSCEGAGIAAVLPTTWCMTWQMLWPLASLRRLRTCQCSRCWVYHCGCGNNQQLVRSFERPAIP